MMDHSRDCVEPWSGGCTIAHVSGTQARGSVVPGPGPGQTPSLITAPVAGPPALRAFRLLDAALRSGRLAPGSRLPAERELARELGISRTTLRQALRALAEAGRIQAAANRGWYVRQVPMSEGPNGYLTFTEAARERGLTASATVLEHRVRPATLDEADALGVPPTAPLLDVCRLRAMDGVPICVSRDRMPASRVGPLVDCDLSDRSLDHELTAMCGIVATRCDYELEALPAAADLAQLLRIAPGTPLLVSHEVLFDQDGVVFGLGMTAYRGDAFRFRTTLYRS